MEENFSACSYIRADNNDYSGTLHQQRELLHRYAVDNCITIATEYKDTASGASLERPGLIKLLNDAKSGAVTCVIVTDLDRLVHGQPKNNLLSQLYLMGVLVVCTAHPLIGLLAQRIADCELNKSQEDVWRRFEQIKSDIRTFHAKK